MTTAELVQQTHKVQVLRDIAVEIAPTFPLQANALRNLAQALEESR